MLKHVSGFPSFLRLDNIPLYVYITFCLSLHPLKDPYFASSFWLLWIMLLWMWVYTEENRIERDTCAPVFITALFIIARTWKQPRCPSADEWIRKLRYIYTMECSVQFSCSVMSNSATPWIAACQASLSITISRSSLRLTSIESVMPSSHLILGHPLLLLPTIPPSIRVFPNESTLLMRWPKYWSFSFSIIPSKEILGLISFRMDCLDLLAVQGTLKNLLQHPSSKASLLQRSAFFTVQLSHPYMTTGKTIALTRRTLVGKVMSLLLNILSMLVITFLQGVSIF